MVLFLLLFYFLDLRPRTKLSQRNWSNLEVLPLNRSNKSCTLKIMKRLPDSNRNYNNYNTPPAQKSNPSRDPRRNLKVSTNNSSKTVIDLAPRSVNSPLRFLNSSSLTDRRINRSRDSLLPMKLMLSVLSSLPLNLRPSSEKVAAWFRLAVNMSIRFNSRSKRSTVSRPTWKSSWEPSKVSNKLSNWRTRRSLSSIYRSAS